MTFRMLHQKENWILRCAPTQISQPDSVENSKLNAVFPNYCFSNLELNVRNVDHLALSLFYSSQFHPSEESTLQMSNLKENPWNQLTRHRNYWICKVFTSLHYHQLNQLDSSGLLLCPFLHVIIFFIFMINFHHPYFVFA